MCATGSAWTSSSDWSPEHLWHTATSPKPNRPHFDEYTNLRQISDWPAFSDTQEKRKNDSRKWLEDRRAELWHDLNDEPVDKAENEKNNRQARYNELRDENLNGGSPKHEYRLPCSGRQPTARRC